MKTKPKTDARERLAHVPNEVRFLHTNCLALRLYVARFEEGFIRTAEITYPISGSIGHVENSIGPMILHARTAGVEIGSAKALLAAIEASDQFKRAVAIVEPLLAEVAELEVAEEEQRVELLRAEQALREVHESAKERALRVASADPEVVAATSKLERVKAATSAFFGAGK